MKIVIDTNIIASSIYFGGKPRVLIDLLMDGRVSESITFEYYDTVNKMQQKYHYFADERNVDDILSKCEIVTPQKHFQICRDPNDDKFIDCAVEGKCIYIVSGDKDLLVPENVLDVHCYCRGIFRAGCIFDLKIATAYARVFGSFAGGLRAPPIFHFMLNSRFYFSDNCIIIGLPRQLACAA